VPSDLIAPVSDFIAARGDADGIYETPIEGLALLRTSHATLPRIGRHMIYRPALCIVAQGAKRLVLGNRVFDYGQMQALIIGLDTPAFGWVTTADPTEPYLGITLDLDPAAINDVMSALVTPISPRETGQPGLFVANIDDELAGSVGRLLQLLDNPTAIPVLRPSIVREIYYWLLTGPHGAEFARLAVPDGHARRIASAIRLLRGNFDKVVRIDELASAARMSPSSFHQHFKALTSMTPVQYQKQLRLLEARRLMQSDDLNVAAAAYQVGYESPSQFSREYARMFGTPPKRDALGLRGIPYVEISAAG
jgi:AraC-like DNA-binding protein